MGPHAISYRAMKATNDVALGRYWKQRFFHVDQCGRSHFRLLVAGLCFVAVCSAATLAGSGSAFARGARAFGVLGILFILWSVIGPSLDVAFLKISQRWRR